jgi:hypothetical protein
VTERWIVALKPPFNLSEIESADGSGEHLPTGKFKCSVQRNSFFWPQLDCREHLMQAIPFRRVLRTAASES